MNIKNMMGLVLLTTISVVYADDYKHKEPHVKFKNKTGQLIKVTLLPIRKSFEMNPGSSYTYQLAPTTSRDSQSNSQLYAVTGIQIDEMKNGNWSSLVKRDGLDLKMESKSSDRGVRYKAWVVEIHSETVSVAPRTSTLF
jgi:hypothetical protein